MTYPYYTLHGPRDFLAHESAVHRSLGIAAGVGSLRGGFRELRGSHIVRRRPGAHVSLPRLLAAARSFHSVMRRPSRWLRRAWSTIQSARQASSRSHVFATRLVTER